MRKKKLIEQNLSLFEELQKALKELSDARKQISQNAIEIENLKLMLEESKKATEKESTVTEPLKRLEEKIITNASLKPDMEYGAKVIGQLVVLAAEYSNRLTAGGDNSKMELVNLILGKTEIAKAEILAVVETSDSFEVKCSKIDQIADVTKEYFESVVAQIV